MSEIDTRRHYTALFHIEHGGPLRSTSFSLDDLRQARPAASNCADEGSLHSLALSYAKDVVGEKFGVKRPLKLRVVRQADYLRDAARELGLEQKQLADRLNTPWRTFEKWLFPETSKSQRAMPDMAWTFIDEILSSGRRRPKAETHES